MHREIIASSGVTFVSRPAYERREFLASPDSAFMTGQLLLADGGRTDYLSHV